jgi:hypothetical protein
MPRISKITTITKDDLVTLVNQCDSYTEVLEKLGLCITGGGNTHTLKHRLKIDNISTTHFTHKRKMSQGWRNGAGKYINTYVRKPIKEWLINGIVLSSGKKRRLITEKVLENKCSECGMGNMWNNKPITLQIDHINGDTFDNRIENLRVLCPNCHTQTSNFAGRNKK